jgi:hypothetical protein
MQRRLEGDRKIRRENKQRKQKSRHQQGLTGVNFKHRRKKFMTSGIVSSPRWFRPGRGRKISLEWKKNWIL